VRSEEWRMKELGYRWKCGVKNLSVSARPESVSMWQCCNVSM